MCLFKRAILSPDLPHSRTYVSFISTLMGDSSSETDHSSYESEFGSNAPALSGARASWEARSEATVAGPSRSRGVPPSFEGIPPRQGDTSGGMGHLRTRITRLVDALVASEARGRRLADATVGAQSRILELEERMEQLELQHRAEVAALQAEISSRFTLEEANSIRDRSPRSVIMLCRRLALLEDPNFRVGILDRRNSSAQTRDQLVDFPVQGSSSRHRDR